ncbi:16 kDa phloem protein 1-like [Vitis riparia]|uniref:Elicitor-responsive protein 1 n=1 Tax=Vitis vinifera TaxID=29760 RepID=A0A438DE94_VITVI|nr:16 kDa phloem protein 1-like [Vitis riparia]RVW33803.1 Elicitor-responsive protein 1 [Vitis vinifera]
MEGEMANGTLEVLLINARRLKDKNFLVKMDPYVLIQYGNQVRWSSVAKGRNPEWNEKFTFNAEYPGGEHHKYKLILRIMDKHKLSCIDDFIGQTTIYVKDLVSMGVEMGQAHLRPTKYRVVLPNQSYAGEISVAVAFTLDTIARITPSTP